MKAPARILAVVVSTLVVLGTTSATAWADSPASEAWPAAPERSWLEWLLLFGGGTVGLFVVVSLFGLLTARNNYVPPAPSTDLEVAPGNEAAHH
ncbi:MULTISPECIES: hypothetical protein [unclassified Aeromicrobium]|uniref:hypothetical protein n=1 Tax=unclassified Aeromicrobium TaxID=2633570 RepID=UPI0028890643|nr:MULTISPECIES: hypothetical protein [unclassified Aeromicrobium]